MTQQPPAGHAPSEKHQTKRTISQGSSWVQHSSQAMENCLDVHGQMNGVKKTWYLLFAIKGIVVICSDADEPFCLIEESGNKRK